MSITKYISIQEAFTPPVDEQPQNFKDYYPRKLDPVDIKTSDKYVGKNVIWLGERGKTLRIDSDKVTPIYGNVFDSQKIRAVSDHIIDSENKVYLPCGYGSPIVVDIADIAEERLAFGQGNYDTDYMKDEPYTTGDSELDSFFESPYEWIETNCSTITYDGDILENIASLFDFSYYTDQKLMDLKWEDIKSNILTIISEQDQNIIDESTEDIQEDLDIIQDIFDTIQTAVTEQWGDFGEIYFQLRDGNHRTFGAIESGEEYVYVLVSKNDMNTISAEVKSKLI